MHTRHIIVLAAGDGARARQRIPKQFASINGYPLVMHTLHALSGVDIHTLLLVLPPDRLSYWDGLCTQHNFSLAHRVVEGGATRYHSAKNALQALQINGEPLKNLVAVHDAARPFVSAQLLQHCFAEAIIHGSAVPVVPMLNSMAKVSKEGIMRTVNRSRYHAIQTPQVFSYSALEHAYKAPSSPRCTDDASLVERTGQSVHYVTGDPHNTKITYPQELVWAACRLSQHARMGERAQYSSSLKKKSSLEG